MLSITLLKVPPIYDKKPDQGMHHLLETILVPKLLRTTQVYEPSLSQQGLR